MVGLTSNIYSMDIFAIGFFLPIPSSSFFLPSSGQTSAKLGTMNSPLILRILIYYLEDLNKSPFNLQYNLFPTVLYFLCYFFLSQLENLK